MTTKQTTRKISGKTYVLKKTTHDQKEAKTAAAAIRKKHGKGTGIAKKLGEGVYAVYQLRPQTKPVSKSGAAQSPKWTTRSIAPPSLLRGVSVDAELVRVRAKMSSTDSERRSRASKLWLSGKEPGTMTAIYHRLHARDLKKLTS